METNYIEVPISELAPIADKALKEIKKRADAEWNKQVDEFYNKNKDARWVWIGKLMYPNRESVEEEMGKVDKPGQMVIGTPFQKLYTRTRQILAYEDFVTLLKNKPDAIVTIDVESYNVLLTWDD